MSRLRAAFAEEPAFIPYLAVGDPSLEASRRYVDAVVSGGADVLELGLPFSEPIAEGPTIQAAVSRALDAGLTPETYLAFVADLDVDVPLVCMTYYNLIYQYGTDPGPRAFVAAAADAGIDGFVVPDLPAEESTPLREACDDYGLDLVSIVAPTTSDDRLETLMAQTSGYVYVQARLGVTGTDSTAADRTRETLDRLADWSVPKAVGFGISSADQARSVVAAGADGIIVGSALVDRIAAGVDAGESPTTVAGDLEALATDLKTGALAGGEDRIDLERETT
ncbi:MAG: tryptophan synthase subunit alpha [Halobacteriaceae archaeon]